MYKWIDVALFCLILPPLLIVIWNNELWRLEISFARNHCAVKSKAVSGVPSYLFLASFATTHPVSRRSCQCVPTTSTMSGYSTSGETAVWFRDYSSCGLHKMTVVPVHCSLRVFCTKEHPKPLVTLPWSRYRKPSCKDHIPCPAAPWLAYQWYTCNRWLARICPRTLTCKQKRRIGWFSVTHAKWWATRDIT